MNVAIAFGAGILSFLSPCVLPLVPAFLVNMAGEAALAGTQRMRTVAHALAFVLGFSVVFTLLWVAIALVGALAGGHRRPAPRHARSRARDPRAEPRRRCAGHRDGPRPRVGAVRAAAAALQLPLITWRRPSTPSFRAPRVCASRQSARGDRRASPAPRDARPSTRRSGPRDAARGGDAIPRGSSQPGRSTPARRADAPRACVPSLRRARSRDHRRRAAPPAARTRGRRPG